MDSREKMMKKDTASFFPADVPGAWNWGDGIVDVQPYGEGHINTTFCVTAVFPDGNRRFILQKINTDTFTDPDGLMENICGVTEFLRARAVADGEDPDRATLRVIPMREGGAYYRGADGICWRVYAFVENTFCLQQAKRAQDFYASAAAFGTFQKKLADYPAETLHETIAHFHDTPNRYANFLKALEADPLGRAASVQEEVAFVRARERDCAYLTNLLAEGKLPLRVTHNDTKLNNVLFDKTSGESVCVVDLDTVMPGLAAYDFGDAIRFGANDCAEDEPDQEKVHFSTELFEVYLRGYLESVGEAFTPLEKETLPWGARVITLECGMRFLTDYLEGDTYFHTSRPGQNLDRARTQFTLVRDMERQWERIQEITGSYL